MFASPMWSRRARLRMAIEPFIPRGRCEHETVAEFTRRRLGRDMLEQAMERLSEDHREVIMLVRIEGLPAAEVAKRMNRSENAIHLLLGRALKCLGQELQF